MSLLALANVEALAQCEDSVSRSGSMIIVTVCNRKTSIADALLGVKCGTTSSSSCSFTNVG